MTRRSFFRGLARVAAIVALAPQLAFKREFKVAVEPETVMVGYKGDKFLDAPFWYFPYMPLYVTADFKTEG